MIPASLALGIQGQAAFADTVVMVAARDGVDMVYAVAAGFVALTYLALFAGLFYVFIKVHRAGRRLEKLGEKIKTDRGVESLRRTAANVEGISDAFRREVDHLRGSVSKLTDRLTQVSDRMEERIEEFNALMEVIQAEAEEAFVDTAAAARGVRTGVGGVGHAARKGTVRRGIAGPDGADHGSEPGADEGGRGVPP